MYLDADTYYERTMRWVRAGADNNKRGCEYRVRPKKDPFITVCYGQLLHFCCIRPVNSCPFHLARNLSLSSALGRCCIRMPAPHLIGLLLLHTLSRPTRFDRTHMWMSNDVLFWVTSMTNDVSGCRMSAIESREERKEQGLTYYILVISTI